MKTCILKTFLLLLVSLCLTNMSEVNAASINYEGVYAEIKFEVKKGFTIEDIIQDLHGANIANKVDITQLSNNVWCMSVDLKKNNLTSVLSVLNNIAGLKIIAINPYVIRR